MKIKRFIGKKVWGYMDFEISFNDGLNFLIGVNGTGKTTVLRLLRGLLSVSQTILNRINYHDVNVEYLDSKGKSVIVEANNKTLSYHKFDSKNIIIPLKEDEKKSWEDELFSNPYDSVSYLELNRLNKFSDPALEVIRSAIYNFIRFSAARKTKMDEEFRNAVLSLSKKMGGGDLAVALQLLDEDYTKKINQLKQPLTRFVDSVNLFFSEGDKILTVDDAGEIIINIKGVDKPTTIFDLSSGEKQLLVMMGHVAFDNAPVYIIDEPEVSLHLSWQYKFAEALQTANPDAQFILATHAAGIIAKKSNEQYCIDLTPKKND